MQTGNVPTYALIFHLPEARGGYPVVSFHDIVNSPQGPILDAGRLLTRAESTLLSTVCVDPSAAGTGHSVELFEPELLHFDGNSMTWFRPQSRAVQYWRQAREAKEAIKAVLPGLVFHATRGALHVAAYAGTDRPTRHTPLFHAPLGNVFENTQVCLGNVVLPDRIEPSKTRDFERALLGSNYTHANHPSVLASTRSLSRDAVTKALVTFWQERQRHRGGPPVKDMVPLKQSLAQWLDGLVDPTRTNDAQQEDEE